MLKNKVKSIISLAALIILIIFAFNLQGKGQETSMPDTGVEEITETNDTTRIDRQAVLDGITDDEQYLVIATDDEDVYVNTNNFTTSGVNNDQISGVVIERSYKVKLSNDSFFTSFITYPRNPNGYINPVNGDYLFQVGLSEIRKLSKKNKTDDLVLSNSDMRIRQMDGGFGMIGWFDENRILLNFSYAPENSGPSNPSIDLAGVYIYDIYQDEFTRIPVSSNYGQFPVISPNGDYLYYTGRLFNLQKWLDTGEIEEFILPNTGIFKGWTTTKENVEKLPSVETLGFSFGKIC